MSSSSSRYQIRNRLRSLRPPPLDDRLDSTFTAFEHHFTVGGPEVVRELEDQHPKEWKEQFAKVVIKALGSMMALDPREPAHVLMDLFEHQLGEKGLSLQGTNYSYDSALANSSENEIKAIRPTSRLVQALEAARARVGLAHWSIRTLDDLTDYGRDPGFTAAASEENLRLLVELIKNPSNPPSLSQDRIRTRRDFIQNWVKPMTTNQHLWTARDRDAFTWALKAEVEQKLEQSPDLYTDGFLLMRAVRAGSPLIQALHAAQNSQISPTAGSASAAHSLGRHEMGGQGPLGIRQQRIYRGY
ncbi:hypothetical protein JCM10908_000777 [Rhodotorula pacifica]|uniref:uncharacterized protein n=1 Tax=Rhodotorula pacifica TaxID=1495444 RepID=UPI00317134D6